MNRLKSDLAIHEPGGGKLKRQLEREFRSRTAKAPWCTVPTSLPPTPGTRTQVKEGPWSFNATAGDGARPDSGSRRVAGRQSQRATYGPADTTTAEQVADVAEPRGGLAPHVPVDSTVTQTSVDCGYQLEFDLS